MFANENICVDLISCSIVVVIIKYGFSLENFITSQLGLFLFYSKNKLIHTNFIS